MSKALFRHCELRGMKQEAIHKSLLMNWIASVFDLAMTVRRAFDKPSRRAGEGLKALSSTAQGNALWIKATCSHSPERAKYG
jgi:hypothetical protein